MTLADAPPLDPSSEDARRWLAEELSKARYHPQPSLLERLMEWLREHLPSGAGGASAFPGWLIPLVVATILGVVAVIVVRAARRDGGLRGGRGSGAFVDDPTLAAADYRERAAAAETAEDWDALAVEKLRALATGAVERTLLDELPGRTAHEAAVELGPAFPAYAVGLREAADTFDLVRYGRRRTTRERALAVRDLDRTLTTTSPVLPEPELADAPSGGPR